MKNIKRILAILMVICLNIMSLTFPGLAASSVSYTVDTDKITITGDTNTTAADKNVSVVLLKNGVTYKAFQEANTNQISEMVVFMKTVKTTAGGNFSVEIKLPSGTKPTSMIAIVGDEAFQKVQQATIIYATDTVITQLVQNFNMATTSEKVTAFLTEYEEVLGTVITKDKQNSAFLNYLASKTASSSDRNGLMQIIDFYNDGMLKESLTQAKSLDDVNVAIVNYDSKELFSNDDFKLIKEKKLDSKLISLLSGKTFAEASDAVYRLNESIFLSLFNNTDSRDTMKTLFEKYNDPYVNVSTGTGSDYAKANKDTLFKTIAAQAAKTPFQDGATLKKAIDKAAPDAKESTTNPNPPGGGGTGGSGGSVDVYPTTTPTPTQTPFAFEDLDQVTWAKDSVNNLMNKGIVAKDPSKQFRPNDNITRQEYVKLLVTALGIYDANATCDFDDVAKDAWYYSYIASAVNKGLVKGVSDTSFGIDENITRQDIATLTFRAAEALGKQLGSNYPEKQFADAQDISDYSADAINAMTKAGIINGYEDNSFRPQATATRAESAVIISKFISR